MKDGARDGSDDDESDEGNLLTCRALIMQQYN